MKKKRKPKIIKSPKARGEWVESVFMARAGELGIPVSRPWGDSRSFDFVVGRPGHFMSVQVKSTICLSGDGYVCSIKDSTCGAYEPGSFDFLAAYVILEDAWYIIPALQVEGKESVVLYSDSKYAKYEEYQEAWKLLQDASATKKIETCDQPTAAAEGPSQFSPFSAFGRMEKAMKQVRDRLEGKVKPPKPEGDT